MTKQGSNPLNILLGLKKTKSPKKVTKKSPKKTVTKKSPKKTVKKTSPKKTVTKKSPKKVTKKSPKKVTKKGSPKKGMTLSKFNKKYNNPIYNKSVVSSLTKSINKLKRQLKNP